MGIYQIISIINLIIGKFFLSILEFNIEFIVQPIIKA